MIANRHLELSTHLLLFYILPEHFRGFQSQLSSFAEKTSRQQNNSIVRMKLTVELKTTFFPHAHEADL